VDSTTAHVDLREAAAKSAAAEGLTASNAKALKPAIEKRAVKRDAGNGGPLSELAYQKAATALAEHSESKAEAEAALDDYLLGLLDGDPFDIVDPCKPGELVRPKFLLDELLYASRCHLLFGREGTNKSMLIIWMLATLATQGRHTLLIEYEMDGNAVGLMLEEMRFNRDELRPFFHQVAPKVAFDAALLAKIIDRFPGCDAVALDNAAEAIASSGGDEHTAKDTLIALAPLRDLAHAENGPAVLIADHLPHARESAARGSTAKGALIDVAFQVETPHPVTRVQAGDIKLTCRKDRPSLIGMRSEIWHTVGDGAGNLPIQRIETPGRITDAFSEDQAAMIVGLEKHAEANPGNPWLSREATLMAAGLGKSQKREKELLALANDSRRPVAMQLKARGAAAAVLQFRFEEVADDAGLLGL
jgi:AAA domain